MYLGKLVKQVVNDVSSEDLHFGFRGVGHGVRVNGHVERQNGGEFRLLLFVHQSSPHHVALVDGPNAQRGDRNGGFALVAQEHQQCFEGAQRGSTHEHPFRVGGKALVEEERGRGRKRTQREMTG